MASAKASAGAGKPTANTGGRIVSLTDGREYAVTGASLVFGREAGCDVVVTGKDVSRRHAEIVTTPKGYMVVDSSTNECLGERPEGGGSASVDAGRCHQDRGRAIPLLRRRCAGRPRRPRRPDSAIPSRGAGR